MTALVKPEVVGVRLNLPQPIPGKLRPRIVLAIEDAQNKVQAYLNRPLVATDRTLTGLTPDERYSLDDKRAWFQVDFQDRYRVGSWVANANDPTLFDVTFRVGLDVASDPELAPILSFIGKDAAADLRADPAFTAAARAVSSVSAGGQSVSYENAPTGGEAVGAPPPLSSLKSWKRHAIYQAPAPRTPPWPYAHRD